MWEIEGGKDTVSLRKNLMYKGTVVENIWPAKLSPLVSDGQTLVGWKARWIGPAYSNNTMV